VAVAALQVLVVAIGGGALLARRIVLRRDALVVEGVLRVGPFRGRSMGVGLVPVGGVAPIRVHVGRIRSEATVRGHIMAALQPVIGSQMLSPIGC